MSLLRSLSLCLALCAAASALELKAHADPCPFGYGTNCGGGKIDSATKAQVAGILEGILSKMSSHKALMQNLRTVRKVATVEKAGSTSPPVKSALLGLMSELASKQERTEAKITVAKMLEADLPDIGDVGCDYFRACNQESTERPITDSEKKEIADILGGIIKNLSSHK
eukprot:TRINITY_DN5041_c0_g1_i1.p2 TRINITY_DN5041_c0_g1~~TRINITY_DN5041_c0_g1_i1.p2  ORF type:complete len:169 (+),score=53.68 TRINITY_DN5041_c0_g1_i1:86-592(+)